jgi:hypothetical protein
MKFLNCISLAALMLLFSNSSYGAQATITWEDGALCQFELKFDPAKYDRERLKNTIGFIYGDDFFGTPSTAMTIDEDGRITSKIAEYQQACDRKRESVANLPLLDLPGAEDARKLSLEQLEETCRFEVVEARAALGDPAALREFTPSAAQCSSYIDALEGKADLRATWCNMVNSYCHNNASPDVCKIEFFSAEKRPNAEVRIKEDVLTYGWRSCTTRCLKTADVQKEASIQAKLEKGLRRLFKIKAYPCSD